MSGRGRHLTLPRPEAGAERDVLWHTRHGCWDAQEREKNGLPREDDLIFPVGLAGYEMPMGVAFEVKAAAGCGACGKLLRHWFTWKQSLVLL